MANLNPIPPAELDSIISGKDEAQLLVRWASNLGETLYKQALSTSQIRALFGEVRQIQAQWSTAITETKNSSEQARLAYRRLALLKPKMAYRARKERGQAVRLLVDVLDSALDYVIKAPEKDRYPRFQHFAQFFEAILAYHKASGGN